MSVNIFFCYAHEDEALLHQLKMHLTPLQRQGLINMWYDRDIRAGLNWRREINEHLNSADIILLLVSPAFIASDYCYSIEMQRALERHERGEAQVIPIIVRPCLWEQVLGGLQALPRDARPITTRRNRDAAWLDVAMGTLSIVENVFAHTHPLEMPRRQIQEAKDQLESQKARLALEEENLPTKLNFSLLSFLGFSLFALVPAASGGYLWSTLNRILGSSSYIGGTSGDPHGWAAIFWAIVTNVPTVLILLILGRVYHFTKIRYQLLLYSAFLLGIAISSWFFYDLPLDRNGLRNYFDSRNVPLFPKEFLLVVIWSALLSIFGFLALGLTDIIVVRIKTLKMVLWTLLKQFFLCVGLTTFAVVCCLLSYPSSSDLRGVIAGLALRMTFFVGLLIGTEVFRLDPSTIIEIPRRKLVSWLEQIRA